MVQLTLLVVPLAGLEPARGLPRGILSPNINHKAQYIVGLINLNHDILCFFNRFPKLPKRQMHKIKYYYFILIITSIKHIFTACLFCYFTLILSHHLSLLLHSLNKHSTVKISFIYQSFLRPYPY